MATQKHIAIDSEELRKWLDNRTETYRDVAVQIGKSASFFSDALRKGYMTELVFNLFIKTFDLDAEQFKEKPKPVPVEPPVKERYSSEPIIEGYDMTLQVRHSRVRVGLSYKGVEATYAWAEIRGNDESALLQAISYATHSMFKFGQLKQFACGKNY